MKLGRPYGESNCMLWKSRLFKRNGFVWGYPHAYRKVWEASNGKVLICDREPERTCDWYAVAMKKEGTFIRHLLETVCIVCMCAVHSRKYFMQSMFIALRDCENFSTTEIFWWFDSRGVPLIGIFLTEIRGEFMWVSQIIILSCRHTGIVVFVGK